MNNQLNMGTQMNNAHFFFNFSSLSSFYCSKYTYYIRIFRHGLWKNQAGVDFDTAGDSITMLGTNDPEFDEDKFVGAGLYLFASVLERFLAQYVSVNSFSQLVAKTIQQKEELKTWLPRNGNRILL